MSVKTTFTTKCLRADGKVNVFLLAGKSFGSQTDRTNAGEATMTVRMGEK